MTLLHACEYEIRQEKASGGSSAPSLDAKNIRGAAAQNKTACNGAPDPPIRFCFPGFGRSSRLQK
jgi:hypothetical protein